MSRAGVSLVEVLIAVAIIGVLSAQGVVRYSLTAEETRVDAACATLQGIWIAERLYRMEHPVYAASLADLSAQGLVETTLADEENPFIYQIVSADASSFVARAERHGNGSWNGTITIDATGTFDGGVQNGGGERVSPPAP